MNRHLPSASRPANPEPCQRGFGIEDHREEPIGDRGYIELPPGNRSQVRLASKVPGQLPSNGHQRQQADCIARREQDFKAGRGDLALQFSSLVPANVVCHVVARAPEGGVLRDGGQKNPIVHECGTDAGDHVFVLDDMFEDVKGSNQVERVTKRNRARVPL